MDPFSVGTTCYAVISACLKISNHLNQLVEDCRNVDDFISQSAEELRCLTRTLRAVDATLSNRGKTASTAAANSEDHVLQSAIAHALKGCGEAVGRFKKILDQAQLAPKSLGLARKALVSYRLKDRASEILQIRQQIQTYSGLLQMTLQMTTVSLLLQDGGAGSANPQKLSSKVGRLVKSIHSAEQMLSYPMQEHLDPAHLKHLERCTKSAQAMVSDASTVFRKSLSISAQSDDRPKSITSTGWKGTFLDSESSESPITRIDLIHVDERSRIEAWITQPTPSVVIEQDLRSVLHSASSIMYTESELLEGAFLDVESSRRDSSSMSSSRDLLNLDAGLALTFVDLGDQSLEESRYLEAETYFRKALKRLGSSSPHHDRRMIEQKIGVACLEQGKYEEAQTIFDKAPDLAKSIIERIFSKGEAFYDLGQYRCAKNCFQQALANTKNVPKHIVREIRMLAGLTSFELEELDDAENHFLSVLLRNHQTEDSRSLEANHALAIVCMKRGDLDQAAAHCQRASRGRWRLFGRDHDTSQQSLALLVDIHEAKGDIEEAKGYIELLTQDHIRKRVVQARLKALHDRISLTEWYDAAYEIINEESLDNVMDEFLERVVERQWDSLEESDVDALLLFTAVQEGRTELLRLLLQDPSLLAKINQRDMQGKSALHHAVINRNIRMADMLLGISKVDANLVTEPEKYSPLSIAITSKNMHKVAHSLIGRRDVDVNQQDSQGHSALHQAAWTNRPSIMADLLERNGIHVNLKDRCGRTALHIAASYGNVKLVKLLLAHPRVDTSCKNTYGERPRSAALAANHKEVADMLLRRDNDAALRANLDKYML